MFISPEGMKGMCGCSGHAPDQHSQKVINLDGNGIYCFLFLLLFFFFWQDIRTDECLIHQGFNRRDHGTRSVHCPLSFSTTGAHYFAALCIYNIGLVAFNLHSIKEHFFTNNLTQAGKGTDVLVYIE